jgi:hypothetical protein
MPPDITDTMPIARPTQRVDMFPARVEISTENGTLSFDRARVRVNDGSIEVWVEDKKYPHAPQLAFADPIVEVQANTTGPRYPRSRQQFAVTTGNAQISARAGNGCGCGSKLLTLPQTRTQQMQQTYQQQAYRNTIISHFPNAVI